MPTVAWRACGIETPSSRRAFDLHHEPPVVAGSSVGGCFGPAATVRVLGSQRAVCFQALWGLHSLHVCDSSGHCPRRRSRASRSAIRELEAGRCVLIFPRVDAPKTAAWPASVVECCCSHERPMPRWSHWPSMGRGTLGAGTASCPGWRSHRHADWRTNSRRGPGRHGRSRGLGTSEA